MATVLIDPRMMALRKLRAVAAQRIAALPPAELAAAEERHRARNRILYDYPDTGPLRRELYVDHMNFFAAGKEHDERAFIGANRIGKTYAAADEIAFHMTGLYPRWWPGRVFKKPTSWWTANECITPWSEIETDRGMRQFVELLGEKQLNVQSWDGSSLCTRKASALFLRGIEPAFQVHLDNGATFQCSGRHRVLTSLGKDGGQSLAWVSVDQIIHGTDGLHCWKTTGDLTASYAADDHQHDAAFLRVSDNVQGLLPLKGDARKHTRSYGIAGAWEPKLTRSHPYPWSSLPSNYYSHYQLADLFSRFEDPTPLLASEWCPSLLQELRQFADEFYRMPVQSSEHCGQSEFCCKPPDGIEFHVSWRDSVARHKKFREQEQHEAQSYRYHEDDVFDPQEFVGGILLPFNPPELFGGQHIIAVIPLGLQPIIDIEVPGTKNYLAAGVIHHNSWKKVRDINQLELLGIPDREDLLGTGAIPAHLLVKPVPNPHIKFGYESFQVRHVTGGLASCQFKTYEQGWKEFEGSKINGGIWLDEHCDFLVYSSCQLRIVSTDGRSGTKGNGLIMLTFTPLEGLTQVVTDLKRRAVNSTELGW